MQSSLSPHPDQNAADRPDDRHAWLWRLADFLIRRRRWLLLLAVLATAAAAFPASRLQFDQSLESMYAADNPRLRDYLESKRLFGGDEFVIVAWRQPDLFVPGAFRLTDKAVASIRDFAAELARVPGIQEDSPIELATALLPTRIPFIRAREKELERLFSGVLYGDDRQSTAIVVRLIPREQTTIPRRETFARIRALAQRHDPPAAVVGEPVQVHDMFRYVEQDGRVLGGASSLLLIVVILCLFRSIRWVLLPLAVVHAALLWTKAILFLSGMQLSMVSSILTSLVTIIGIATVTHVTVRFRELRRTSDRTEALRLTMVQLAPPIFWTILTTATGFAALLSSRIMPVRSFAIMMSVATLLVLVAAALILPGGILLGSRGSDPRGTPAEGRLLRFLNRLTDSVARRPFLLGGGLALVAAVCAAGLLRLEVETDFSRNFRADSPIVQSLNFVEENLGGAGNWEVNFAAPEKLTPEYMSRVGALADELRTLGGGPGEAELTKVIALTDGMQLVPYVPLLLNTVEKRLGLLSRFQPEFVPNLYNARAGRMRIVLRALERQPSERKLRLIAEVERVAGERFPGAEVGHTGGPRVNAAEVTGLYVLLAFLIESLLEDQLVSFGLAAVGIIVIMTVAFRSLAIGLISLVPNLFPIVLVIGGMGLAGVPVNIGTAMIASVSLGLTVDSSIHFLWSFRTARRRGLNYLDALRETHQGTGRALIFANVALVLGFTVLTLSNFIPLVYFGLLVSVAMAGGLLGNLVLLPVLLRLVEK